MLQVLKRVLKALAVVVGVILVPLILSIGSIFVGGRDVAPGVTAAGIEKIRPGMSSARVLQLLGRPYYIDSYKGSGTHDTDASCKADDGFYQAAVIDTLDIAAFLRRATADSAVHSCDIGDSRAHDRNTTFTYSRPVARVGHYPMLWVHFDSTARVSSVFAKQYTPYLFLEDDAMIYSHSADLRSNFSIGVESLAATFD